MEGRSDSVRDEDASDVYLIQVGGISVRSLPPRPRTRRHHAQGVNTDTCASGIEGSGFFSENMETEERTPSLVEPPAAKEGTGAAVEAVHDASRDKKTGFEYLDHTADVIIHAWGPSLSVAFANAGKALFNYMTDIERVEPRESRTIHAAGKDLEILLFHFMDELLFLYGSEYFVACDICVQRLEAKEGLLVCEAKGEVFDPARHSQGTEVKAITMHELKVRRAAGNATELQGKEANGLANELLCRRHDKHEADGGDCKAVEVFVLVDI